ncbi:MAG: nucleotide sugar dehydrogenase [Thermoproteota archaeon]|jgi:UDPglucose 6-dehydrogenase
MKNVSVFGLGYVGLSTAVCFSSKNINVVGYDIDKSKIDMLNKGVPTIYEEGLEELLKVSLKNGKIKFTSDYREAVMKSDITFITVGTPSKEDKSIDLSYIESAATQIGEALREKNSWHLVVVKSTVVPGTTEGLVLKAIEKTSGKKCGLDFGICMNPEFLKEGSAIRDTLNPDRIIIGEYDRKSGDYLEDFYKQFYDNILPPILRTSLVNAELIKYANNAFLAMKISFINMIANLCQVLPKSDVEDVAKGIGYDKRIGNLFLKAGIGWGGSCFPKDLAALKSFSRSLNLDLPLLDATMIVNEYQPINAISLVESKLGGFKEKVVAVLGLAFKAGTDDIRESIAVKLVEELIKRGAKVKVYDPVAMENAFKKLGNQVYYAKDSLDCISNADCAIVATEWEDFKKISAKQFKELMRRPLVFDGRRIYNPKEYENEVEFLAIGLGRKELEIPKTRVGASLNPSLAVNAIVTKEERILLVKRKSEPFKGFWSLPGGFVEYGETVEEAVKREVKEETGLTVEPEKLIGVYSERNRHPGRHVVAVCYSTKIKEGKISLNLEENEEVKFFSFNELPKNLAFDHNKMILDYLRIAKT